MPSDAAGPRGRDGRGGVAVLGGGAAGFAAAVSAARAGVSVVLFERGGALGGAATAAGVHSICGLFPLSGDAAAGPPHPGFAAGFYAKLRAAGAAGSPRRMGRVDVALADPLAWVVVAERVAAAEERLAVHLHTEVVGLERAEPSGFVVTTRCRGESRRSRVSAVVDATGDAESGPLLGITTDRAAPDRLQRPAWIVRLIGVEAGTLDRPGRLRLATRIAGAVAGDALPRAAAGASFCRLALDSEAEVDAGGPVMLTLDVDPPGHAWNPTCGRSFAEANRSARETVLALLGHLRREQPGFGRVELCGWPARPGVRESRRLRCRFTLTGEHLLRGFDPPDAVAWAYWPMESRERADGPRFAWPQCPPGSGEVSAGCGIPLSCLRAAAAEDLFVAGRCIGTDHEAQAATRVIGTCLATGEAAGLAAAWVAAERARGVMGPPEPTADRVRAMRADLAAFAAAGGAA